MNEILLVAILLLPESNNIVYEVQGTYANVVTCNNAKRQYEKQPQRVKTTYMCLPPSKD
jgi:hypothetical protein